MKKIVLISLLLIFLVACGDDELPPSPPPPGGDVSAGQAMAGIPIPSGQIPTKYTAMVNTDISPTVVKDGDTLTITIDGVDYAYGTMYILNKFNIWEKVYADTSLSGKVAKDWTTKKGVFKIKVSDAKIKAGQILMITYGCKDTGNRNEQGYKIWNCNSNSNKWGLGSAEMSTNLYAELIQKPIENNDYLSASKSTVSDGILFLANYKHKYSGVKTDVSVLELSNVGNFKQMLKSNLAVFEPLWNLRSQQICGFLKIDAVNKVAEYSWLSSYGGKNYWLTAKTLSTVVDDAKITAYVKYRYPSDCNLLNELKQAAQPYCGNGVKDGNEQCDMKDASACPGACRPDCYCMKTSAQAGTCGDCFVNPGEQCEPPAVIDILGQIKSGSSCWVQNMDGSLTEGHCNPNCMCEAGKVILPKCGNGLCENDESQASCAVDCCGAAQPPAAQCIDTDDENYYYKGTVTRKGATDTVEEDNCVDANKLEEMVCSQDYPKEIACPYGCDNGVCKPKSAPTGCPDALSVWSHDDKINGRNIWFSAYWDTPVWAVKTVWKKSSDVVTGEAQSLTIFAGDDNDPDIATWPGQGGCGNAIVVWSNVPSSLESAKVSADVSKMSISADTMITGGQVVALASSVPNVMYSIWNDATGWDVPKQVAPNGYDPAVDVTPFGNAVSVWVRTDGLYYSKYSSASWSAAKKVITASDVTLPQITYNAVTNKWFASWISGSKTKVATYDFSSDIWSPVYDVPGLTPVAGSLVLPERRIHIDSQWSGKYNTIAYSDSSNKVQWWMFETVPTTFASGVVDSIFSPDVDHDFVWDNFHVIGKGNSKERYFDGGVATAADAFDMPSWVDGRPAHTYVRISNHDIAVAHSENEGSPYMSDIYWSRRTAAGWSPVARLVSTGLNSYDRNTDIAPLYSFSQTGREFYTKPPNIPPTVPPYTPTNPPGIPGTPGRPVGGDGGPGPGPGGGGGGDGDGNGGGDSGGGDTGQGSLKWQPVKTSGGTTVPWICFGNCPMYGIAPYLYPKVCPNGVVAGQTACTTTGDSCIFNYVNAAGFASGQILTCNSQPLILSGVAWQRSTDVCSIPYNTCPTQIICEPGTQVGQPCLSYDQICLGDGPGAGSTYRIYTCQPVFTDLSTAPTAPFSDQPVGEINVNTGAGDTSRILTGGAIYTGDASDSNVTGLALFLIAAFGILVVTLVNFVHRDE